MSFPLTSPTINLADAGDTLQQAGHTQLHNSIRQEVIAIAAKVGIDGDTTQTSHDYKLSTISGADKAASKATVDSLDYYTTSEIDTKIATAVADAVAQSKEEQNPVGSLYYNADNGTNPATLLGFGTWELYGSGRVLVGLDSTDTDFDTAGETGGAKTADVNHKHNTAFGWDGNNFYAAATSSGGNPLYSSQVITVNRSTFGQGSLPSAAARLAYTDFMREGVTNPSVVQPYITVYIWKRTA